MIPRLRTVTALFVSLALGLATLGCGSSTGTTGSGENYPSRTVKVIVPYEAGGPTDVAGRVIAKCLGSGFGKTFVVENRAGASGALGLHEVSRSKADGLTLVVGSVGTLVLLPIFQDDVKYSVSDFSYTGVVMEQPSVLVVKSDSPYKNAADFFRDVKDRPGSVNVAVPSGLNGTNAVELRRMAKLYDLEVKVIPFEGAGPATTAMLGGKVDAYFATATKTALDYLDKGRSRALAVGSEERLSYLSKVPTLHELGYPKLVYSTVFWTLAAPKDTPAPIVTSLQSQLKKCLEDDSVVKELGTEYVTDEFQPGAKAKSRLEDTRKTYEELAG